MPNILLHRLFFAGICVICSMPTMAKNTAMPVLLNYILDDITQETVGHIYVPEKSESGIYTISWYLEATSDIFKVEELQMGKEGAQWKNVYEGTGTDLTLTKPSSAHYRYRLKNCKGEQCGEPIYSEYIHVAIPQKGPTNVVASQQGDENVVKWDPIVVATSITLAGKSMSGKASPQSKKMDILYYVEESINGEEYQSLEQTDNTNLSHKVKSNGTHRYRVKACEQALCTQVSAPSNVVGGLAAPNNFSVSYENGTANLSWEEVPEATYYRLNISSNGGKSILLDITSLNNYVLDNPPEGELFFELQACDASNCYEMIDLNKPLNVSISQVCMNTTKNLKVYANEKGYFIGNVRQTNSIHIIPSLALVAYGKQATFEQEYWQVTKLPNQWNLTPLSIAEFKQIAPNSGGLQAFCRQNKADNSANITFRDEANAVSFNINARFDNMNSLQLQLNNFHSPITINYPGIGYGQVTTSTDEFIVSATPSAINQDPIDTIEFSINGMEWFEATLLNGIFSYNFHTLDEGKHILQIKINGALLSTLSQVLNVQKGAPKWYPNAIFVAQKASINGLLDTVAVCQSVELDDLRFTVAKGAIFYHASDNPVTIWQCFDEENNLIQEFNAPLTIKKLNAPVNIEAK